MSANSTSSGTTLGAGAAITTRAGANELALATEALAAFGTGGGAAVMATDTRGGAGCDSGTALEIGSAIW